VNKIVKKSVYFTIPLVFFVLSGALYFSFLNKGDAVIWFNNHHSAFGDVFFKYATYLGDGKFTAAIAVGLLLYRPYWFIQFLTAVLSNAVVVYILKREIFNFDRPLRVLSNITPTAVEDVHIHEIYSFPSGHTNSTFLLGIVMTLLLKDKKWGIFFFFIAMATAISRMYLFQHFFMDVYVGGLIGVLISILTFYWVDKSNLKNKGRLQQGLIKF
jgi:membrane-associated phospholipid phosphatase